MFQHDIICNMLKLRILSLVLHWLTGLTNSAHFAEIRRNSTDSGRSEFKNRRIYCPVFQNFRKDKNQQKICKKTRSNCKVIGEEFFCKTQSFGLVKFKFCQICLNLFKRVRPNSLFSANSLFIRPNYRQIRPIFMF
jgi:hypothetical protein